MIWTEQRNRLLVIFSVLLCALLFWWAGGLLHIPLRAGYGGCLLSQPNPILSLVVALVLLMAGVIVGTALAGGVHSDAGLFSAAAGLLALSMRNGNMGDVLRGGAGRWTFAIIAAELLILGFFLLMGGSLLNTLRTSGWIKDDSQRDGLKDLETSLAAKVQALGAHAIVTALAVGLIAQSDDKEQVVAAVMIGSYLASLASHSLFPVGQSAWLWCGPLVAGLAGYMLAAMSAGVSDWRIGLVGDHLGASLARPLPLDWAGAGTIGALAGYWTSRRWMRARQPATPQAAAG
jgi:hypothetical protein